METIERLKEFCQPVFVECGVRLYNMKWLGSGKERTLEVAIMREDGSMDLDTCAVVSDRLSEILDGLGTMQDSYMLEVCSPGAEREIRDLEELSAMDKPYVFIRLKHPISKKLEWYGTVLQYEEDRIQFEYKDKTAVRTAEITADDIDYLRLAVRF
ncbi:MAG: ribosome maturation factor RimP [Solobacterium sp.]|nr:ribosome maturation factor RimP [Solobacterium sp.]